MCAGEARRLAERPQSNRRQLGGVMVQSSSGPKTTRFFDLFKLMSDLLLDSRVRMTAENPRTKATLQVRDWQTPAHSPSSPGPVCAGCLFVACK